METNNNEQDKVIKQLEEVLNYLKSNRIKNEESLIHIKKPLEDLRSSLKYLPSGASFEILPTEIKTDILGYLCDSGAFLAASVCQDWKNILKSRLEYPRKVIIGKHCSNWYECEDTECFMPEEMFRAAVTLDLKVHLSVCSPVTSVNSSIVAEGLTSGSSFSIIGDFSCHDEHEEDVDEDEDEPNEPIMTKQQLSEVFECFEKGDNKVTVELVALDLNHLNQDTLMNCLLYKTFELKLDEGEEGLKMFNVAKFIEELKQASDALELTTLILHKLDYPDNLSVEMADALCKVGNLFIQPQFILKTATLQRIISNILAFPNEMPFSLDIVENINWSILISSENLKILLAKVFVVVFRGTFTAEQMEAARSVEDVKVGLDWISKYL